MQRDAETFNAMADACRPRVHRAACMLLDDPHEAEDVTQRVFMEAWRGWARFQGRSDPFTWLYTILRRVAARHRRQRWFRMMSTTREAPDPEAAAPSDPVARLAAQEAVSEVRALLCRLSPKVREVLVLRYIEEYPLARIAEVLGIPEGTVKSRIHFALRTASAAGRRETPPAVGLSRKGIAHE